MQNTIPFEQGYDGSRENSSIVSAALNHKFISNGKITLHIKTREAITSTRLVEIPVIDRGAGGNLMAVSSRRIVTKDRLLDQEQEEALRNCVEIANNFGIKLEVKDLSREGVRDRLSGFLFGRKFSGKTPSVAFDGGAMTTLVSANYRNRIHDVVSPPFLETRSE